MMISIFDPLTPDMATSEVLGGKGHGLWFMQQNGVNVPPALVIPTGVCVDYMQKPKTVMKDIAKQLPMIREFFTEKFGYMPLLSVRSGARVSMPGMMDTILNVGLDKNTADDWRTRLGDACAQDSYKRLIVMYGNVVDGIPRHDLEKESFVDTFSVWSRHTGKEEWLTVDEQILGSIEAVFKSWNNERAIFYRKQNNIPESWGTAVVLQAMVFGNMNEQSCTGVLFTRNPDNGLRKITGEFLVNAQGEDVVAGIRTPQSLSEMGNWNMAVSEELAETVLNLEKLKGDVQDVEFTVQDGKLYILQTRNAKRSPKAAVKIALDMYEENLIEWSEASKRVDARTLDLACQPQVDPLFKVEPKFTGIPACSGVVTGRPVFSAADAVEAAAKGEKVLLVTKETTPDDIKGMDAAVGVITMEGGSTSHAAVVARAMNKPCITGVGVDIKGFQQDKIGMCGATGRIWFQDVPVVDGGTEVVSQFIGVLLGDAAVCVNQPPKFKMRKLMLDGQSLVLMNETEIVKLVTETAAKCEELQILLPDALDAHTMETVGVFLAPDAVAAQIKRVRGIIDSVASAIPEVKAVSWESKSCAAIDCVTATDIVGLINVKKSGYLIGGVKLTPKEVEAYKRVMKWLADEGVKLIPMGMKGGVAALSVQLNA